MTGRLTRADVVAALAVMLSACASFPAKPASATATDGRNQVGANVLAAFRGEARTESAGDGVMKVTGESEWTTSPGFEVFYARQIFAPTKKTPMEVMLDLPVTVLPLVRQPPSAKSFDPVTGRETGGAPDYEATYFTPRVSLRYRTEWPVQVIIGGGGGVGWISETRDGQPYHETGYPVVFIAGLNAGLRPHWAVRVSWGLLVHGIATERGLYLASGGIVSIF